MKLKGAIVFVFTLVFVVICSNLANAQTPDPLPSWNDGKTKAAIHAFVKKVTTPGTTDYVPPAERIATFDNDGTLWAEKPTYVQLFFAVDRVKVLAPQHLEWKQKEPFASLLKGDLKAAMAGGKQAILEIVMATHAGMTTSEFEKIVTDWMATAKNPKTNMLFTDMVYQPMLEYARTILKLLLFPAVASSSCVRGRKKFMASHPNRSSAVVSRRSTKCATAIPYSFVYRK